MKPIAWLLSPGLNNLLVGAGIQCGFRTSTGLRHIALCFPVAGTSWSVFRARSVLCVVFFFELLVLGRSEFWTWFVDFEFRQCRCRCEAESHDRVLGKKRGQLEHFIRDWTKQKKL